VVKYLASNSAEQALASVNS